MLEVNGRRPAAWPPLIEAPRQKKSKNRSAQRVVPSVRYEISRTIGQKNANVKPVIGDVDRFMLRKVHRGLPCSLREDESKTSDAGTGNAGATAAYRAWPLLASK